MPYTIRTDLGGALPLGKGVSLLNLLHLSDVHVLDSVSPARCEWVELLGEQERWKPLLHTHRPYEALTHWVLAAHVDRVRQMGVAPWSQRPFTLALSTGDNIDNAQINELDCYLRIVAGGQTALSALGGVHTPSAELGDQPWPFWCPEPDVADTWKPLGYPVVEDYVARASATLHSQGLGFAWASVAGNHDFMRQGTALCMPEIEAIALGCDKTLAQPVGFAPDDPLSRFVSHPHEFSQGATRQVEPNPLRCAVDKKSWVAAHLQQGALGFTPNHVQRGCADAVIDTEHVRIIILDTNHPAGDYQGSIGKAQLDWLDQQLSEVDRQSARYAIVASHHGSASLTNTRGNDPERVHAAALTALAHQHRCVVAWLVGHRHLHRITAHPGANGGFWEITTASLIDWPSQTRAVELLRHSDGTLELVCTPLDHQAAPDSLAALHLSLAHRFAAGRHAHMQGQAHDGFARLLLSK